MPNEEQVRESLDRIPVPGVMRSLVKMNLVREVRIADQKVDVTLASAALSLENQEWLKDKTSDVIQKLEGVEEASVSFVDSKPKDINEIRHVIAIMSGKGGVGKSLVASLTAIALKRQGYEVGILDADITGPSIPRMFGVNDRPMGTETGILPVLSRSGIEIMSINLLLPSEDDAVIWRGPLISGAIKQFWQEVIWGQLDTLVVDLPPGTSDASLTVMQSLPLSGVVLVTSPQDLAGMVVRKAAKMAQQLTIPILGLVENMSYFEAPDTGTRYEIFGPSHAKETASRLGVPLLGHLPLNRQIAELSDAGHIEEYPAVPFVPIAQTLIKTMPEAKEPPSLNQ